MDNSERPFLIVQEGPNKGEKYILEEALNTVGRTPDNQVVVDSTRISRRHIQIKVLPAGVIIEDTGSTNGTWVNGQRLTGSQRLDSGDIIQLADYISLQYVRPDPGKTERLTLAPADVATQAMGELTPTPAPAYAEPSYPAHAESAASYTPAPAAAATWPAEDEAPAGERPRWVYMGIAALAVLIIICLIVAIYLWFAPESFWHMIFDLFRIQYP